MDWNRPAPGGPLAIAGYLVLVLGVVVAFWLYGQQQQEIRETDVRIDYQICIEQNRMREAMVEVQRSRQPLPTPEDASTALQRSIERYNERQKRHIDRFAARMHPLDCDKVRDEAR